MNIKSRWTEFKHWNISRPAEKALLWFVYKLPKKLVYWSAIRVGANATTGNYSNQVVPELNFMEALKRWDNK